MNIDLIRRRIMMNMGIPLSKWEKLADRRITEGTYEVDILAGDNGQVLNDYDVLLLVCFFTKAEADETMKILKLNINGGTPWGGRYFAYGAGVPVTVSSNMAQLYFDFLAKTPIGIIESLYKPYNDGSLPSLLNLTNSGGLTKFTSSSDDTLLDNPLLDDAFVSIKIGNYITASKAINVGSRFQIYGAKL